MYKEIRLIFDAYVDPANYVLVINASGRTLDSESLKKVTHINPLLESSCKTKNKDRHVINWKATIV